MNYPEIIINTDGGARGNPGPAAIGIVAQTPTGQTLFELSEYLGVQTNNVAEYTAVIHALDHLKEHEIVAEKITFILDSELIVRQILGQYRVKEAHLQVLNQKVKELISDLKRERGLKTINFLNVLRAKNKRADQLVNQALDTHQ